MERLRRLAEREREDQSQRDTEPERSPLLEPFTPDTASPGEPDSSHDDTRPPFSWPVYAVFSLLGVAMLWAWSMFLTAAPYFQKRFAGSDWIQVHFLSAIMLTSTITNLATLMILTKVQANASYQKRIAWSLLVTIISFVLLTISTVAFEDVGTTAYFVFVLGTVFASSLATGLCQNGLYAYVTGFGRAEYMQAIMMGQAIAGVLPCIIQVVSVLSVPAPSSLQGPSTVDGEASKSAMYYFLTSTFVSTVSLGAFVYLLVIVSQGKVARESVACLHDEHASKGQPVAVRTLFRKLCWLWLAVATCFVVSMMFPVFTKVILSVRPAETAPRIFQPASFIPLGFLFWNIGDLLGRLLTLVPQLRLTHRPKLLFLFALTRAVFVPLYVMCNRHGRGAIINSDWVYLGVVQLGFGASNGWLASSCMMGAASWVAPDEREAAGGFMGLMLVAGLTIGSLLSFLAATWI